MYHPFLIGEKIYLRGLERKDLDGNYFQWLNDYEVTKYLRSGTFPNSMEALESYFNRVSTSPNDVFFAIIEKGTERHIGNLRVSDIDWLRRTASIGRMIGEKDCWGKGYGLEALKLAVDHCFKRLNLHKVIIWTAELNIAPQKNYEKLGFVFEGRLRQEIYVDGKYYDRLYYGILKEEWKF